MSTLYADPVVLWSRLLERVVIDEHGGKRRQRECLTCKAEYMRAYYGRA